MEIGTDEKGGREVRFLSEIAFVWDSGKTILKSDATSKLKDLVEGVQANSVVKRKGTERASSIIVVIPDTAATGNIAQVDPVLGKAQIRQDLARNIKKIVPVTGEQVIDFDLDTRSKEAFIFAVRSDIIKSIVEVFSDLEFNVERVEVRSHALRSTLPLSEPVLLIDGKETTASLSVWDGGLLKFLSYSKFEAQELKKVNSAETIKSLPSAVFEDFFTEIGKLTRFFHEDFKVIWTGSLPFQIVLEERIKKILPGKKLERFDVKKYLVNWPKGVLSDVYVGLIGGALSHYTESDFALLPADADLITRKNYMNHAVKFYQNALFKVAIGVFAISLLYFGGLKVYMQIATGQKKELEKNVDVKSASEVQKRNENIRYAQQLVSGEKNWSLPIDKIVKAVGPNTLTELGIGKVENILIIRGISPSRDTLLDLESRLREEFDVVETNPNSFKKGSNLDFTIEVTVSAENFS